MATQTYEYLKQKYGYVNTWTEGQAAGTDFSRSHKPEIVDRLKRAIEGTNKRQRVFGPAMVAFRGQDKWLSETNFRKCKGLRRKGGIGRYLATDVKYGSEWNTALTDALFDVKLGHWEPGTPGYSESDLKGLRFPTVATLLEFLDHFLDEENKYTVDVHLTCYWLEDATLPDIPKVLAWNAFFGALCGDYRKGWIVSDTAFDVNFPPNFLEDVLKNIWQSIFGGLPAYGSLDEFRALFWMHGRSRGDNRYRAAHRIGWKTDMIRFVADAGDGFATIEASDGKNMGGTGLFQPKQLVMPTKTICNGNGRDWMKQDPAGAEILSQILIAPINGVAPTSGDWCAVAIHPMGIDTILVPWQDPSIYDLQVVTTPKGDTPQRIRTITDHGAAEPGSPRRSRPLNIRDWCFPDAASKDNHNGNTAGMRWHLKGSPFVGPLSDWRIRHLRETAKHLDGYVVK